MKLAATNLPSDFFQRRRFGEVVLENCHDLLHALPAQPLVPLAEQFLARQRLIKQRRRHFQRLGLIPQSLRRRINGRTPQAHHQLLLFAGQANRLRHRGRVPGRGREHPAQARIHSRFTRQGVAFKEWQRQFNGDELMPLATPPPRFQPRDVLGIKPGGGRGQFKRAPARLHLAVPGHVQANLQTAGMKTARPIQVVFGRKIMPLDAVTQVSKVPIQLPPAVADRYPCGRLGKPGFFPALPNGFFNINRRINSHTE